MDETIENLEKCSSIANHVVNEFAGVCNRVIAREKDTNPAFEDTLPSIIAGSLQFLVKTLIIAGYTKEDALNTIAQSYDVAQFDKDVLRAKLLHSLVESMGNVKIQ